MNSPLRTISASMEIGTANPNAMEVPLPDILAKAVPKTPPVITSGGMAAPNFYVSHKYQLQGGANNDSLFDIAQHQTNKRAQHQWSAE